MNKTLVIIEVSQKQAYIFASNELKSNVQRSKEIAFVTSSEFFKLVAGNIYNEEKNLINAGGGHTVLQFDNEKIAEDFVYIVTKEVMMVFPEMEIFAKIKTVDTSSEAPGELFLELTKALEEKKSLRRASFHRSSYGIENLDKKNWLPSKETNPKYFEDIDKITIAAPKGYEYPLEIEKLTGTKNGDRDADNFIAIIHVDGNNMGAKVKDVYDKHTEWNDCCKALAAFSKKIQNDYETAFVEMVSEFATDNRYLSIRPLILAGDDISYIARGDIGVQSAKILLDKIASKSINGVSYSACAGVAIVHQKFPFHMASDIAEELCSNAKRFGSEIDAEARVSAIDWHIEFGQLKYSISEIREDYLTDDGNRLELRPLAVTTPEGVNKTDADKVTGDIRTWNYFEGVINRLHLSEMSADDHIARSKFKQLRSYLKQGEVEAAFYIKEAGINIEKVIGKHSMFEKVNDICRSTLFDAIELSDHYKFDGGDQ